MFELSDFALMVALIEQDEGFVFADFGESICSRCNGVEGIEQLAQCGPELSECSEHGVLQLVREHSHQSAKGWMLLMGVVGMHKVRCNLAWGGVFDVCVTPGKSLNLSPSIKFPKYAT